ncbi:MAG: HAD family hydrolase, partial [Acidimicrobiales bacterium]
FAVIDSGTFGVAKPDPAISALALDSVGVDAARAVHVGDTFQYDVRGARAAGVHPVLVDPLGLRTDTDCDRIASLTEVATLLT